MSINMTYGVLICSWLLLLALVAVEVWRLLHEEGDSDHEPDPAIDEPRLVSACRELSELAAKTKEASHG
ncbi:MULTISPECIES: hypothetical protein [Aeromonas]|nr:MULTISPECIES: hypothetical protein [Aeromonas]EIS3740062.1 hypothetical protein [Aeromonas hydrophila]EIS3742241.1 hypothetical protein [Aeromonas hydrophila]PKD25328.1 hypothetical protein AO056_01386 [Aeromonas hydrophila]BBG85390.1 hypothetical protein AHGSH82_025350 [Aeromonas hydrophila]BBT62692.1 hypothetical protein WP8S18E02_24890 [Aeromonas hydrophila]